MNRSKQRANGGLCKQCSTERPPGRTTYCSDECSALGTAARQRRRQANRLGACRRCGGEKQGGVQGGKYCEECRRLIGDTTAQLEYERGRRRNRRQIDARAAAGDHISRRKADAPEGTKWCARCQDFRPFGSFPPRKGDSKYAAYCRPCQRFYNSERRIKLQFGLTWDEYELLLACQDGRCAICGGKPRKHLLAVDHDHKTGEIRGLLCSRCNHRLLGSANDDPTRLRKAADYLESFAPREVFGDRRYAPGYLPEVTP